MAENRENKTQINISTSATSEATKAKPLLRSKLANPSRLVACVLLSLVLICLSGCTTFDNFKAAFIDKPQDKKLQIRIGVLEPVTGADSKAAEEEIRGIQLANEAHPNVDGKEISLVFSDTKSDLDATETAVQTLINKNPTVILGSYGSVYSLAASPHIKDAKIPAIAITNLNPLVTKNNEYYFRVCYVDSTQGDLLARYVLEEEKARKAGVLLPEENDAAMAMATAFTDRIKAETGNDDSIPIYENYKTGQKDFSNELKKLKKYKVKYVILPGEYTDAANIISQAAEMGLNIRFLGDTSWGSKEFKAKLASRVLSSDMAFVQFFASDGKVGVEEETKERKIFIETYEKKFGNDAEPSESMALGYDAYFVAIDAIDKAGGDAKPEDVKNILADSKYSFEGAGGEINFNSNGDPIKTAYISTWRGSKITTLATIKALK